MDYCFFAVDKTNSAIDSLSLSLMWQVEADCSYHIIYTPDKSQDTFVALRTLSGEGELVSKHGIYKLEKGSLLILPIHTVLEYRTTKPLWSFCWFEFTGCPDIKQELAMISLSEAELCLLDDLISALCSRSSAVTQAGFKYIFSRWIELEGEAASDIALQVARYINASPTEAALSFESLLDHFKVSERTLRKRFQEAFKMSPRQYILDKRLKLSSVLLKTTDMRLRDIAAKTGFQNEYYFSTCFKKHYGVSPSEYREGE